MRSSAWALTMVAVLSTGTGQIRAQVQATDCRHCAAEGDGARRSTARSDGDARLTPIGESERSRRIEGTSIGGTVNAETIGLALSALPRRPTRLVVVDDAAMPPAVLGQVRELDAFVPVGSRTIYLRHESPTLREAEMSQGPYVLMLAAVIWHELAHVEGCDEAQAREREEVLWREFVRNGRVDSAMGLSYLAALRRRR